MAGYTYSGLAIGGPFDGQIIEAPSRLTRLAIPLPVDMVPNFAEMIEKVEPVTDKVCYVYISFHFNNEKREEREIGFWVPWGTNNPNVFVMDKLVESYFNKKEVD